MYSQTPNARTNPTQNHTAVLRPRLSIADSRLRDTPEPLHKTSMRFLVKWEDRCTPSCQTLQPNTFHQSRLRWCEGFPAETEDCRDDRPQYVLERHPGRRRGNGSWPHWHTPPCTQPNYKAIFDAGKGHEYRYASPPARPNHKATLERSHEHHMHNCLHSQIKTSPYHLNGRGSAWREDIHTATTCFDDRYN
jgi:hypothetical protein